MLAICSFAHAKHSSALCLEVGAPSSYAASYILLSLRVVRGTRLALDQGHARLSEVYNTCACQDVKVFTGWHLRSFNRSGWSSVAYGMLVITRATPTSQPHLQRRCSFDRSIASRWVQQACHKRSTACGAHLPVVQHWWCSSGHCHPGPHRHRLQASRTQPRPSHEAVSQGGLPSTAQRHSRGVQGRMCCPV